MEQIRLSIPRAIPMVNLIGVRDTHLQILEEAFPQTSITVRGNEFIASGESPELQKLESLINELLLLIRAGETLNPDVVRRVVGMTENEESYQGKEVLTFNILSARGKTIRPKTANQKRYVEAIDGHTITFGIGPAGTGKTYLAMAKAIQALQSKEVSRIILTRPAVEAGEKLGFLPGTLQEKIDPYLRPLLDALQEMIDPDSIPRLISTGVIEIAPLAYMRGRTLNGAFVILDEAQNTSPEQMKMFLTRLGFGSKMVVTGDNTQTDLPNYTSSGLREANKILSEISDIAFVELGADDVVRNRLVGEIVRAYGKFNENK
jgi:phosphate starvation-inducible protein PhoH and related proteins